MRIIVGADHRGFAQKEKLKEWLREEGYVVEDRGAKTYEFDDDYPEIAFDVAEMVVREQSKGILWCGSGVGMTIAANKVNGARAGLCSNEIQALAGRNDDDMNILCISSDISGEDREKDIIKVFLETPFGSEERYIRRLKKVKDYESEKR